MALGEAIIAANIVGGGSGGSGSGGGLPVVVLTSHIAISGTTEEVTTLTEDESAALEALAESGIGIVNCVGYVEEEGVDLTFLLSFVRLSENEGSAGERIMIKQPGYTPSWLQIVFYRNAGVWTAGTTMKYET